MYQKFYSYFQMLTVIRLQYFENIYIPLEFFGILIGRNLVGYGFYNSFLFFVTFQKIPTKCHLKNVLMASEIGCTFLKLKDSGVKKLTDAQQKVLIKIIIEYCLAKQIVMGPSDFDEISNQICTYFPLENSEAYFIRSSVMTKGNPAGPLYTRFNYRLKKAREINLTTAKSRKSFKKVFQMI